MRTFKIPFDVSGEEKIFKGILSFRQMAYMAGNILCVGIFFIKWLPLFLKILIFLPIITLFSLCAFLKIEGIHFDKYIIYFLKYIKRQKEYVYKKY